MVQDRDDLQPSSADKLLISRPRLEKLLIIFGASAVMTGFAINHLFFNNCGTPGF